LPFLLTKTHYKELSAELESEERKLTDAKSQLKHEQYLSEMHQLSQQRADNETRIKQSQKNIQQLSEEHDNLQVELNRLQSDAESQELDVIGFVSN
jgi:predicted  nucleic acid-binding Zn-ribbon protein